MVLQVYSHTLMFPVYTRVGAGVRIRVRVRVRVRVSG
jgi:hypothetical protein